jgi:hypothetical protein
MSPAPSVPSEVEEYVAAVRRALADLPSAERDDLLAEVEASLLEATEEGAGPIAARLGAPEKFAAELRAAAGLHEPAPPVRRESDLGRQLRAIGVRVSAHPAVATLRRLGRELAPIWWVLRAYLAVGAIAYVAGSTWSSRLPIVPRLGSAETGLAVIVIAVVVSVWLGLELRKHGSPLPRLAVIVNAALLLAAIPVVAQLADSSSYDVLVARGNAPIPGPPLGLLYDGGRVENIYPYSRDGRLLHDVFLYDSTGRPIEIQTNRALDPYRRVVFTSGNRPLFNMFPIRYYEPGTTRVAQPNAAPDVKLPRVLYVSNRVYEPQIRRIRRPNGSPYVKLPPVSTTTSK